MSSSFKELGTVWYHSRDEMKKVGRRKKDKCWVYRTKGNDEIYASYRNRETAKEYRPKDYKKMCWRVSTLDFDSEGEDEGESENEDEDRNFQQPKKVTQWKPVSKEVKAVKEIDEEYEEESEGEVEEESEKEHEEESEEEYDDEDSEEEGKREKEIKEKSPLKGDVLSSSSHPTIPPPSLSDLKSVLNILTTEGELGLLKVLHSRLSGKMVVTRTMTPVEGYIQVMKNEIQTWNLAEEWFLKEQLYPTLKVVVGECLALKTGDKAKLKEIQSQITSLKVINRVWEYLKHRLYDPNFVDASGSNNKKKECDDPEELVDRFVEECLRKEEGRRVKYKLVRERYKQRYHAESKLIGRNKLLKFLIERGFEKDKVGGEVILNDVTLR